MANIKFDHGRLLLTNVDPEHKKIAAKALGVNSNKRGYTYPCNELSLAALLEGIPDLKMDSEVEDWWSQVILSRKAIEASKMNVEGAEKLLGPLETVLKLYQKEMVSFGMESRRFINKEDRGLGKTLEALSLVQVLNSSRVLVVVPSYLSLNWAREIKKWLGTTPLIARGERSTRTSIIEQFIKDPTQRFLIVNYEMLRLKEKSGGYPILNTVKWDMVIFDEGHRLKNRNTSWVEGAKKITYDENLPVQILTGNPIDASAEDIWSLLNILAPKSFTSFWAFVEHFCIIVDNFYGKEIAGVDKNKMAALQYALLPYVFGRPKAEVAPELPKKIYHPIYVELEGTHKLFYRRLEKQSVLELASGDLEVVSELTVKHLRLQQAIANPVLIGGKPMSVVENTVIDLLSDIMDNSDKCIVGTWFVEAATLIEERVRKQNPSWEVYRVRAELNAEERDRVVEAFKASRGKAVLVGTLRTMGEGLSIDECDHMILADKGYTPLVNDQFEDRIHRVTSTRTKHYYPIIVQDTISEDKEEILERRIQDREEIWALKEITKKMMERVQLKK